MKKHLLALLLAAGTTSAFAQAVNVGDLLVYRVGATAGTDTEVNTGNAVFLDEWTTSGSFVRTYNTGIFASGTATSEGLLNVSQNGQYVTFTGYAATAATSLSATTGSAVNRTVGVLDVTTGTITKTSFSDLSSGNNPRSAVTNNGTDLWMAGGAGGVRYGTVNNGATGQTSTSLSTTVTNIRDVKIFNGQLYASDSSGTTNRLGTVGTGLPTTGGQTIANLPGFATSTGSPYSFFFADLNAGVAGVDTLYVADDSVNAIQKFSLVGGSWVANGTAAATGVRGLTGKLTAGGGVQLYGSTGSSTPAGDGSVYALLDTTGYNATLVSTTSTLFTDATLQTFLGTSANNYAFRGVALIPEPSAYAPLLGAAGLAVAALRRRRHAAV